MSPMSLAFEGARGTKGWSLPVAFVWGRGEDPEVQTGGPHWTPCCPWEKGDPPAFNRPDTRVTFLVFLRANG